MIRGDFMSKKIIYLSLSICIAIIIFTFAHFKYKPTINPSYEESIPLPIIMYHSILKDTSLSGKYVITPNTLDNDIKYLHSMGYTTVSMAEVIDYVENNNPLPEKPVMLTFDDGCYNNLFYAVPILKNNNARGIFSIVGIYTEEYSKSGESNISYGYLKWNDIYEMYLSPNCEIGNHSYNFHNTTSRKGSQKNSNESIEDYTRIFTQDTLKVQEECYNKCGFYPQIYTYPYGIYSNESIDIIKQLGFKASFSCVEGINSITHNNDCLYLLKRYNRPSGPSSSEFFRNIIQ